MNTLIVRTTSDCGSYHSFKRLCKADLWCLHKDQDFMLTYFDICYGSYKSYRLFGWTNHLSNCVVPHSSFEEAVTYVTSSEVIHGDEDIF